jgi:hypothetical protein
VKYRHSVSWTRAVPRQSSATRRCEEIVLDSSSDFLLQVAKVCRAQAKVARIEHDTNEEAKFLLLGASEGKAAEHQAKRVQKLRESHGQ